MTRERCAPSFSFADSISCSQSVWLRLTLSTGESNKPIARNTLIKTKTKPGLCWVFFMRRAITNAINNTPRPVPSPNAEARYLLIRDNDNPNLLVMKPTRVAAPGKNWPSLIRGTGRLRIDAPILSNEERPIPAERIRTNRIRKTSCVREDSRFHKVTMAITDRIMPSGSKNVR